MTKRCVILNAKRERIRNPLERERIATGLKPLAMTRGVEERIAAAPAVARNDKGSESRKANCNDSKGLQA